MISRREEDREGLMSSYLFLLLLCCAGAGYGVGTVDARAHQVVLWLVFIVSGALSVSQLVATLTAVELGGASYEMGVRDTIRDFEEQVRKPSDREWEHILDYAGLDLTQGGGRSATHFAELVARKLLEGVRHSRTERKPR